mmetsp:Transcript_9677/g.39130  ORF Transcript_9677/g.39130 Transcript_9677/m.39130 type:complete len:352 (+) Transcript_9677:516-1571(+)
MGRGARGGARRRELRRPRVQLQPPSLRPGVHDGRQDQGRSRAAPDSRHRTGRVRRGRLEQAADGSELHHRSARFQGRRVRGPGTRGGEAGARSVPKRAPREGRDPRVRSFVYPRTEDRRTGRAHQGGPRGVLGASGARGVPRGRGRRPAGGTGRVYDLRADQIHGVSTRRGFARSGVLRGFHHRRRRAWVTNVHPREVRVRRRFPAHGQVGHAGARRVRSGGVPVPHPRRRRVAVLRRRAPGVHHRRQEGVKLPGSEVADRPTGSGRVPPDGERRRHGPGLVEGGHHRGAPRTRPRVPRLPPRAGTLPQDARIHRARDRSQGARPRAEDSRQETVGPGEGSGEKGGHSGPV